MSRFILIIIKIIVALLADNDIDIFVVFEDDMDC